MRKFELPKIKIENFSIENIVTTSTASSAARSVAEGLKTNVNIKSVNIVDWKSLTAE